ncbi:MAG: outer rane efflux protein [Gemmatimonadetes bacterium]|nr:outer rane efflux protein [Gemmatimonadota bacterium]
MNASPIRVAARRAMLRPVLLLVAVTFPAAAARAQQPAVRDTAASRPAAGRALTLDEALRLADRESEALQVARAGVSRAEGQQRQARSQYLPQVGTNLAYNRTLKSQFEALAGGGPTTPATTQALCTPPIPAGATDAERAAALAQAATCPAAQGLDFSRVGFGARNQYTLGLGVNQAVFTGGRIAGQVQTANAGRRLAEIEVTAQRAQLALDVTQAYFDAVLADVLVVIADSTLAQTEELLRQTSLGKRVGNTSEFELLRATVTRDNQRPVLIQRRGARDIAYLRLRQLLNIPLDEPLALTTPIDEPGTISRVIASNATGQEIVGPLATVPTSDTSTALRAPVRESAEAVRAQEGLLRVARAERLPAFSINTNYQRLFFPSTFLPSLNEFSENWTVGGAIAFSLFNGGRVGGQVQVAQANLDEARARLEQARELAGLDTRVAINQLQSAEASFAASRGTAQLARRAYGIDQLRYREGISTQTDLTQSRLLLEQALANQAQSARDLAVARARVALIRDLPINLAAFGAAGPAQQGQGQGQQGQQQQQQQQRAQGSATSAGAAQSGVPTP